MFIWLGAIMMGGAGVKYWRGSLLSIRWFCMGIMAIPWIIVSKSVGAGDACPVWSMVGILDGVSSSDSGSGSFLQRYRLGVLPPFLFSPYFPSTIFDPIIAKGTPFT